MPAEITTSSTPLIFLLGGARSGKSAYALERARQMAGPRGKVLFIATAQAGDEEMAARIARHRAERPGHWQVLEAPLGVGRAWREAGVGRPASRPQVALLDCITLLTSNAMFAGKVDPEQEDEATVEARVMAEIEDLLAAHRELSCPLILVSNEVGLGIVPAGRLSRLYRDILGRVNRRLAAEADQVLFLLAGIPLDLTRLRAEGGNP